MRASSGISSPAAAIRGAARPTARGTGARSVARQQVARSERGSARPAQECVSISTRSSCREGRLEQDQSRDPDLARCRGRAHRVRGFQGQRPEAQLPPTRRDISVIQRACECVNSSFASRAFCERLHRGEEPFAQLAKQAFETASLAGWRYRRAGRVPDLQVVGRQRLDADRAGPAVDRERGRSA